jgi:phage terminase large subunit GpA-like protein
MTALPEWYRQSWAVPPKPSLSAWADAKRYLSTESNPTGGRWHTATLPYLQELMDTISDEEHRVVIAMLCSQAGKTETLCNHIGRIMDVDPGPILAIFETIDNARAWSKERFEPMLRDTPCLRGRVVSNRGPWASDEVTSNQVLHKSFPGGVLTAVGSLSPRGLDQRPIRYVIGDEWDGWAPAAGEEGDQFRLAEKRTTWFFNAKIVMISTPRLKSSSRIEPAYLASDQRRYFLPCPHCAFAHVLLWENFKWEIGADGLPVRGSVHFVCPQCQRPIEERERPRMLAAGHWQAGFPARETAGFHLWAAYCPPVSWYTLAREYLEDHRTPEKYKVFVNTRKAETWVEGSDAPEWEAVKTHAEDYAAWTVPHGVGFVVIGADVQDDRLEFSVWGFGRDEEAWLIGHEAVYGNTELDAPYLAFERKAFVALAQPTRARQLVPLLAFVDSGAYTQQVYHFARTRPQIYAIKGSNQQFAPAVAAPTWQDIDYQGKKIVSGVQLWSVGVHQIKALLYRRLKIDRPGPRYLHFPAQQPDSYYRQLVAERLIVHPTGREEWKREERRNEALDCAVYAYAAARLAGLADPRTNWEQLCPVTEDVPGPVPVLPLAPLTNQPPLRPRGRRGSGGLMQELLRG